MATSELADAPDTGVEHRARDDLYAFEAMDLLPVGRWDLLGVGIGLSLAVLVVLLSVHDPLPLLAVIAGAAVAYGVLLTRDQWFQRYAEFVTILGATTTALLSGGDASPFRLFLLFPVVWSAVTKPVASIRVVWATAAIARFSLVATNGLSPSSIGEASLEVGIWVTVGAGIWGLRHAIGQTLHDLQRSHQVHRALLDGHSSGVYVLDRDFRITEVNDALLDLLGWERTEVIGQNVLRFVPSSLHREAIEFAQFALRGTPMPYESLAVARDGESVPMLVTHARIEHDDGSLGLYGILQDLRGLREERDARVAMQRRFEQMAESSTDGMFVVLVESDRTDVQYVNPALAAMLGLDGVQDVDAEAVLAGLEPNQRVRLCAHLRSAPPDRPVEFRYRRPDGSHRWLELRDTWHEDAAGRRIGRQGIIRDVTRRHLEREALDEALANQQQAADELRRTQRMQRTFLQNLSHEVRTPLTVVSGMLSTLRRHGDAIDGRDVGLLLARAEANANRLQDLLLDLLDVERLRAGSAPTARPEPVDLAPLVEQVIAAMPEAAWRTSAHLEQVTVLADPRSVERVVLALVGNAVQYAGSATIRVEVRAEADHGLLVVEDDGPGIDPALLDDLFEPFAQGEAALASAQPGTGVGLALSQRLVEAHGGSIVGGNRPDGGARFEARLPRVDAGA